MIQIARSSQTRGSALRRARRATGLTQQELASPTGLRQATISGLENGRGGMLDTVFAVVTALNLEIQLAARSTSAPALDDLF